MADKPKIPAWFRGELIGTYLLVFFGLGSVAIEVAFGGQFGLFGVAMLWGLGLMVAISVTGPVSGAHLNPAITIAFATFRGFPKQRILPYIVAQIIGAFLAAASVYFLSAGGLAAVEEAAGITRGHLESIDTAKVFVTFYPHPGNPAHFEEAGIQLGLMEGIGAEFLGTALLAITVFGLTSSKQPKALGPFIPILIGVVLAVLISLFAPVSMAGFNPARDIGPRLWTVVTGWGSLTFSHETVGWILVYIVSPCLGALFGAGTAEWLFKHAEPADS
ncbi:MAG: aquaporin [Verrucomicrobiota bacterium]